MLVTLEKHKSALETTDRDQSENDHKTKKEKNEPRNFRQLADISGEKVRHNQFITIPGYIALPLGAAALTFFISKNA